MIGNFIRKIMAHIIINRIGDHLNFYFPDSQSAYRHGRSTSDLVLAKRI